LNEELESMSRGEEITELDMTNKMRLLASLVFVSLFISSAHADEETDASPAIGLNDAFAIQGDVVITQAELDAEFSKIPAEHRLAYIRNGERVNQLVGTMLRYKIVAADARAAGFDEDILVKARMQTAAEKELAEAWIVKVMEDAPAADYEALANEFYLANPDAFMTPEFVDVTHILIGNEDRSREEAMALADSLHDQLIENPALFDDYVEEYSDDPSKGMNQGSFHSMQRGEMIKPFEDASFAMEVEGEISEPVETNYGFHIIRFNKRFPPRVKKYEDVKADAMTMARKKYLEEYRTRYIRRLIEDPIELPEGAVEAMAKRHFGENLELAPKYQE
jgi:peptidyl-prolyl cis-trans isomerase C